MQTNDPSRDEPSSSPETAQATPAMQNPNCQVMNAALEFISGINERGLSYCDAIPSGFEYLESLIQGFRNGQFLVLASLPAIGKSALAMNFAQEVARYNLECKKSARVGIFSLHTDNVRYLARLVCSYAGVSEQEINRELSRNQMHRIVDASESMKNSFFIDDTVALSLLQCQENARVMKKEGANFIVVDSLSLMRGSQPSYPSRDDEVAEICAGLKNLARELHLPILLVANLRGGGRPQLSDLRHADAITEYADVIMLLDREVENYRHLQTDDLDDSAQLYVAKNRNGPTGKIPLHFKPK